MSAIVLLDSSAWIEILKEGSLVKLCQKELQSAKKIIVPTLVLFEVYRKITQSCSEDLALSATALLGQYEVADLTREVALTAADLSLEYRLAMADSFVLAHAQVAGAILITLDNDFSSIGKGVKILRRP